MPRPTSVECQRRGFLIEGVTVEYLIELERRYVEGKIPAEELHHRMRCVQVSMQSAERGACQGEPQSSNSSSRLDSGEPPVTFGDQPQEALEDQTLVASCASDFGLEVRLGLEECGQSGANQDAGSVVFRRTCQEQAKSEPDSDPSSPGSLWAKTVTLKWQRPKRTRFAEDETDETYSASSSDGSSSLETGCDLLSGATSSSSESTCSHSQSCAVGRLLNELRIDTPELFLEIVTKRSPLSAEFRFIQACHSEYWAFVPAHTELREQAWSALDEEQVTRMDQLCVWFTKQQQIELLMDVLRQEHNLMATPQQRRMVAAKSFIFKSVKYAARRFDKVWN
mmetsp:Transcript_32491/g.87247  ORF Transcript_32491/g.87247 Transcript_32491/m.87247 type:complete len:338 (-) Transcript_32491:156-1169(-)